VTNYVGKKTYKSRCKLGFFLCVSVPSKPTTYRLINKFQRRRSPLNELERLLHVFSGEKKDYFGMHTEAYPLRICRMLIPGNRWYQRDLYKQTQHASLKPHKFTAVQNLQACLRLEGRNLQHLLECVGTYKKTVHITFICTMFRALN